MLRPKPQFRNWPSPKHRSRQVHVMGFSHTILCMCPMIKVCMFSAGNVKVSWRPVLGIKGITSLLGPRLQVGMNPLVSGFMA